MKWILDSSLVETIDFRTSYLIALMLIIFFDICLIPFDSSLSAFQMIYLSNKFLIVNNILKIFLIIIFLFFPSITFFVLCNYFPRLLTSIITSIIFLKKHEYMFPKIKYFCLNALKKLIRKGLLLSLTKVSNYAYLSLPIIIASQSLSIEKVGYIAGMLSINTFLKSILIIVTGTLLPTIKDASNEKEIIWMKKTIFKFGKFTALYIFIISLLLFFNANKIISLYLQETIELSKLTILGWILINGISQWEHYGYIILLSIDKHKEAISLYFCGAILSFLLINNFNISLGAILFSLCSGRIFTLYPYSLMIKNVLSINKNNDKGFLS